MDTHIANLEDRARLQAEKEEADNQRFMDLQDQCDQQLKRFEA